MKCIRSLVLLSLFLLSIFISCNQREKQYLTDRNFIKLDEKISNDKKHKITEYYFDIGALGFSRVFWAILPLPFEENEPLNDYIIPDGYKAISWTNLDEVILEKWQPYYYKDKEIELKTGDTFNDTKVMIK